MDVLAEVLSATRVGVAIYGRVELRAPWAMRFDRINKAGFHIVQRGSCWLRPAGRASPILLAPGDVVMLPRGWTHTISDRPDADGEPYSTVIADQARRRSPGPPSTTLLCGAYAFDDDAPHPLLGVLPHVLHAPAGDGGSARLGAVAQLLAAEIGSSDPGAETVARRLVDVLFVYVVRDWLARQPDRAAGWLGALRDPPTQRALAALHEAPARDWTLPVLARAVGVSRATLARRFSALVGEPPLAYLRRWRMTLAAQALRDRDVSLGELATRVGYASDVAFHKAFTRERGCTPAVYRRRHAAA
ncbi:MAG: AraC family transcriptional regulator [Minicystis sp.]